MTKGIFGRNFVHNNLSSEPTLRSLYIGFNIPDISVYYLSYSLSSNLFSNQCVLNRHCPLQLSNWFYFSPERYVNVHKLQKITSTVECKKIMAIHIIAFSSSAFSCDNWFAQKSTSEKLV